MKKMRKISTLFIALSLILTAFIAFPAAAAESDFEVKINFMEEGGEIPEGYLPDYGEVYGERNGYTYGWTTEHTSGVRDRGGANDDLRLDTNVHFDWTGTWEIEVPNGEYEVTIAVGDSLYETGNKHGGAVINLEGVNVIPETHLDINEFIIETFTTTVEDGKLTIDNGMQAREHITRINYIDIKSSELSDEEPADEEEANDDEAVEDEEEDEEDDEEATDERATYVDDEGSIRWENSDNVAGFLV